MGNVRESARAGYLLSEPERRKLLELLALASTFADLEPHPIYTLSRQEALDCLRAAQEMVEGLRLHFECWPSERG